MKNVFYLILTAISTAFASHGSISGNVSSSDTMEPIPGAFIIIDGTEMGAVSDIDGDFIISDVLPGGYVLRVSSVGYHPLMYPDVMVRPGRITSIEMQMEYSVVDGGTIHVTPDYFTESRAEPVSRTELSGEQIRRSPGSAGDVSRVISALPAISKVDDQYNGMAVRGGNPMENANYVDGMQVPNINHFPRQGTSGGGLGMVNTDLIQEVRFSAGGFSPKFGNRLSSVMEIDLREGNREEFDGQIDLSMSGFGTVLEGPLENGSWLVCARRSYIDLLVDIADIDALPTYSDCQAKIVLDIDSRNRLTFSALGADDYVDYTYEQAFDDGNDNYGITDNWNATCGFSWRRIWENDGFSNTAFSYSGVHYGGEYYTTLTGGIQAVQNSTESAFHLRNTNTGNLSDKLKIEFGVDLDYGLYSLNNRYSADTSWSGEFIPELLVKRTSEYRSGGIFSSASFLVIPRVTVNAGLRFDYNESFDTRQSLSPRGSVFWEPSETTSVSFSTGIYRQPLPVELLSRSNQMEDLKEPSSIHAVLSLKHLLSRDTRLQLEIYSKSYRDFPYDPDQPGYFILDGVSSEQDLYSFGDLLPGGEARAYGVELTLRKQLVSGLYGLAAASASVSEYRNPGESWRRRIFDNRWTGTVEGGYRLDENWEFSCRWLLAGGRPYTPLDIEASSQMNRTILDSNRINGERYPYYSSVNIRADRRFNFQESSLICYISVWNLLNRRNVTATYWNRIENREDEINQWGMMPIFGLEYEF